MSLESIFPNLKNDGYLVTSPATTRYNCIAWAAGTDAEWWDPAVGYYWPSNIPRGHSVDILKAVFADLGFVECASDQQEPGYVKIALYGEQGEWTHAARMLDNGKWTSKLGPQVDIEHATPYGLVGADYGRVVCILRRPEQGP